METLNTAKIREMMEIMHINNEEWVAYLTEIFRRYNDYQTTRTTRNKNTITDEITETDVTKGIKKRINRKYSELLKSRGNSLIHQL